MDRESVAAAEDPSVLVHAPSPWRRPFIMQIE
jgi:hypothetical protein